MKSKFYFAGLAILFLFAFNSCKSKESAYKKAYDQARAREVQQPPVQVPVVQDNDYYDTPTRPRLESFQLERVTAVDNPAGLLRYNVVIGSFANKTNAISLKERMEARGYSPILAQNERQMYRVIVASYDYKEDAHAARDRIKAQFAPEFQDAWLLEKAY